MQSDGSYSHAGNCPNPKCEACAYHRGYAEGRKAVAEKLNKFLDGQCEDERLIRELARPIIGSFVDGDSDCVPGSFGIVEKLTRDFRELLEIANRMRRCVISVRFDAWKKARGIG